jgi:hypothetical protein
MPEDGGASAQPVWWAPSQGALPGGAHRGKGALGEGATRQRKRRGGGDGTQDGEGRGDRAVGCDRTWRAQDLGRASCPATELAPRTARAVTDEGERGDLGAYCVARDAGLEPPGKREGDRREIEQATRSNRGRDDEEDRPAALAGVSTREDREQRRRLEGGAHAAELALAQTVAVQDEPAIDRATPRATSRAPRGSHGLDRGRLRAPGLDRQRAMNQSL